MLKPLCFFSGERGGTGSIILSTTSAKADVEY